MFLLYKYKLNDTKNKYYIKKSYIKIYVYILKLIYTIFYLH